MSSRALRDWVARYKLDHGCSDCGYRAHPEALDFDHLPGFAKQGEIARLCAAGNGALLRREIEKCEVVCANCHRVRTAMRRALAEDGLTFPPELGDAPEVV